MPNETAYAISDLARLTGLNVRTIRYYIAQGLIPSSGESGPGAHYGEGHLDRLRLTKRLQQQHLPLAEIRHQLAALTDDDVAGLVSAATEEPETPPNSALDYVRSLLGEAPGREDVRAEASGPRLMAAHVQVPPHAHAQAAEPSSGSLRGLAETMPIAAYPESAPAMPRMRDVPARPPAAPTDRPPTEPRATEVRASEPQPPERSQWERHSLGPNIELHVRRPLSRLEQRRVERLITIARQVLKEDGV